MKDFVYFLAVGLVAAGIGAGTTVAYNKMKLEAFKASLGAAQCESMGPPTDKHPQKQFVAEGYICPMEGGVYFITIPK